MSSHEPGPGVIDGAPTTTPVPTENEPPPAVAEREDPLQRAIKDDGKELPTRPPMTSADLRAETAPVAAWPSQIVIKWWEIGCSPPAEEVSDEEADYLTGTYETRDATQVRNWLDLYFLARTSYTGPVFWRELITAAMTTESASQFRRDLIVFTTYALRREWPIDSEQVFEALADNLLEPLAAMTAGKDDTASNGRLPTGPRSPINSTLYRPAMETNRQRRQRLAAEARQSDS